MKTKKQLLHDLLQDEHYAAFRDDLLANSIRELSHRRRFRRRTQIGVIVFCLLAASLPLFLHRAPLPEAKVQITRTETPQMEIIRTPAGTVESALAQSGVTLIRTEPGTSPQSLNDDQLLAMFPGQRVGLIVLASGKKQLYGPDLNLQMAFQNNATDPE